MQDYNKYNNDYEKGLMGFPSVYIPEEQKDDKYHMNWAKGMYSKWYHGKTAIPRSYQDDFDVLRQYGKGNQPIDMYLKDQGQRSTSSDGSTDLSKVSTKEAKRSGRSNLSQHIVSIAPRVKSMIKAYLQNVKEDAVVDTIDPVSGAEREGKKWRTYLYAQDKEFIDEFQQNAGLKTENEEFLPETIDELEMYDQAGGFKLTHASDMERLVKASMDMSGYEHDLEDDLYDDLMDWGIAATKKKLDPEDNKFKDYYVNPKYLVVEHSQHLDFRDIGFAGHVDFYPIHKIRTMYPEMSEEKLKGVAYAYKSQFDNPSNFEKYDVVTEAGTMGYDDFLVAVFEAEWIDVKVEEKVFYNNKRGKATVLPVNDKTKSDKNARYKRSDLNRLRQASWIVGTDCIFDWGVVNMQDRPAKNKVISNYHIYGLSDSSLVAQLRPVLDDMMIARLRYEDACSRAVAGGYAINVSKLKAISDGEKAYSIAGILKMWKEQGLLLYQDSITGRYEGGKTLPIDALPSNLIDELNEYISTWNHALKVMEDLTGINSLILGAAPDPDAPVATQKLSVASSANAIKPLGVAMNDIKRKSAGSFMRRFVLACKVREDIIKSYEGIVGRKAIERLTRASKSAADYGMKFTIRPTEAEKAALMESINISMQNRREGRPGIDLQTKMFIEEQLYAGVNLKWLRFYIGYKERQIFRQDQEAKERMINLQADRNDRSAQIAAQSNMQREQMKHQGEAALTDKKSKSDVLKELVQKDEGVAKQVARRMGLIMEENPITEGLGGA